MHVFMRFVAKKQISPVAIYMIYINIYSSMQGCSQDFPEGVLKSVDVFSADKIDHLSPHLQRKVNVIISSPSCCSQ